ncbi:hypothetical protein F8Z41_25095 [Escherichia coli]|nr:hypothetical protein [Escherichia coli]
MSIKNDGHYFCRAGGNRPDGLNEPVTKVGLNKKIPHRYNAGTSREIHGYTDLCLQSRSYSG